MKPAHLIALAMGICLSGCGGLTPQPVADFIVVNVKAGGELTIDGPPSSLETLGQELTAVAADTNDQKPMVRIVGDEKLLYRDYMAVLNEVQKAGLPTRTAVQP